MSDRPFDQYSNGSTPPVPTPPATTTPVPPAAPPVTDESTGDVAKQEAASVGQDAKEGADQVAQTAKEEVQQVAQEAKSHAQGLFSQVQGEVTDQARGQQQKAAGGLHTLAGELDQMASSADGSTMAGGLVQQAAERVNGAAGWLEGREPADLLDDVKRYARRNPGTFLAVCGLVGFLGGRLTRGLRDDAADQGQGGYQTGDYGYATPGTTTYQPVPDVGMTASATGQTGAGSDLTGTAADDLRADDDLLAVDDEPAWEDGERR